MAHPLNENLGGFLNSNELANVQMDSTPKTRLTLINKIKDPQDAEAWGEFTAIYYPLIFEICRRKGLQHADSTDITQEVLSRVADSIESYQHDRSGATFRGWLYCITRNLTVDYFRQQARDPLAIAGTPPDWDQLKEPTPEESQEFQIEFKRRMFSLVAKSVQTRVASKTWAVFWKTEIEGIEIDEVALELDMSKGAVYVARSRVIAKLRNEVQKRLDDTGSSLVVQERRGKQ